jgi:hypothetical protein
MNESLDLVKASLLEGFSLPATDTEPKLVVLLHRSFYSQSSPLNRGYLLAWAFFRPPISHI